MLFWARIPDMRDCHNAMCIRLSKWSLTWFCRLEQRLFITYQLGCTSNHAEISFLTTIYIYIYFSCPCCQRQLTELHSFRFVDVDIGSWKILWTYDEVDPLSMAMAGTRSRLRPRITRAKWWRASGPPWIPCRSPWATTDRPAAGGVNRLGHGKWATRKMVWEVIFFLVWYLTMNHCTKL